MADFTPNEGVEEMLKVLLGKITQPSLFLGLFSNTAADFTSYGDDVVWSNLSLSTNYVGGDEKALSSGVWSVPTGSSKGNPAVYSLQTFEAAAGGATAVTGYYIRSENNVLWAVGLHPDVILDDTPKAMPAGAQIEISPQLGMLSNE